MGDERVDIKMIIGQGLKYWYLFAIILPLVLAAGYLYLTIAHPKYESRATLLIKDEKSGKINEEMLFKDLGLNTQNENIRNEIHILNSTPLMREVVENLGLQYQYFEVLSLAQRDLYKNSPVQVSTWQPLKEGTGIYVTVNPDEKGGYLLQMEVEKEQKEFRGDFGKPLVLPMGKLTLTFSESKRIQSPIGISIVPVGQRAAELIKGLSVEMVDKEANILDIYYKDIAAERTSDVLKELIKVYNRRTVDSENQVFKNTIDLINERISLITEELSEAEQDVQNYKQRFSMVGLSSEGDLIMNEMSTYNKQIAEIEVQLAILESIESFLEENKDNFDFVPTNSSLTNLTLTSQLADFNKLLAEKERLSRDWGPSHPDLQLVDKQIRNLRQTIIENISSMRTDLQITRNSNEGLRTNLENRLSSLPRRERELIEIERRKNIKENLYLYLLQKREESAISMAVTMSKGEVVEPPETPSDPVSPVHAQIWLIAGFLGLAIPAGILLLIVQLNDKIITEEDIEKYSKLPVAGVIAMSGKKKDLVIRENSRSLVSEMFRMLRANLAYIAPGKKFQSILVTSVVSGEGKSFITLNLGMTLALSKKKVVILHADLRKPRQVDKKQNLNLNGSKNEASGNGENFDEGIVNYLVNPSYSAEQIIYSSPYHPNLDLIGCGPKPPNPGELILSERFGQLIEELRNIYDFIIIDSPPVGIVADALQMKNLADATLFVVRSGYSPKNHVRVINSIAEHEKLPKPFIVLNGINLKDYTYAYGSTKHGYGYGYSYAKKNEYFEEV